MKTDRAPDNVSITIDGQAHTGQWVMDGQLVRVTSAYGVKSTQLGESPAGLIAMRLLRELVETERDQILRGR